jgi:hypothetical protein
MATYANNEIDLQVRINKWREACHDLFEAEVDKAAAKLVEERLAGPYSHRYKGVAVTEEQFWLLMKAEGFDLPTRAK